MDWFNFGLNGVLLTIIGIMQLAFSGRFTGRTIKPRHYAFYLFILYAGDITASLTHSDIWAPAITLSGAYAINRLAFKNSRLVSCAAVILAYHIPQLSFGIINPLEMLLFPGALGRTPLLYFLIVLASLLALAICQLCYRLILKQFSIEDGQAEPYIWLLLPPVLFFSAMEFYILNTAYGRVLTVPYPMDVGRQLALLILQLLELGALLCSLFAYRRTCAGFRAQESLALLTQEMNARKAYVAEAQMRYEQTRAFRHDLKNHLAVLDGLLKKEYFSQAQDYLKKLDIAAGELSFPVHTGNPVIDILLGDKLELAKNAGIETEVSLTLPQSCSAVDDLDLCVIFFNALDNAVRACMQTEGQRAIRITGERQGDLFLLEFENTCSFDPLQKQTMGTGLSNVKAVAVKYGGTITIEKSTSLFCLSVLLNISTQSDDRS